MFKGIAIKLIMKMFSIACGQRKEPHHGAQIRKSYTFTDEMLIRNQRDIHFCGIERAEIIRVIRIVFHDCYIFAVA